MSQSRDEAIELAVEALKQWAAEGTVSAHYLESVLGVEEPVSMGSRPAALSSEQVSSEEKPS
jgi:mannitol/fructose-specific phosphotransferase system IIA component